MLQALLTFLMIQGLYLILVLNQVQLESLKSLFLIQLATLLAIVTNYIGTIMNKAICLIIYTTFILANTNMYWDLGVAVSSHSNQFNTTTGIDLST